MTEAKLKIAIGALKKVKAAFAQAYKEGLADRLIETKEKGPGSLSFLYSELLTNAYFATLDALKAIDESKERAMTEFLQFRRKQIAELRAWVPGEDMQNISMSSEDRSAGSPKLGDMVARNPKNHKDQWLVSAQCFVDNFEPV